MKSEEIIREKSKKNKYLLIVLAVSLIVIATSFAYFVVRVATPAITDVNLGSETSEKLIFTPGTAINLNANITNFGEGSTSLIGSTSSSAQLIASSTTGTASSLYQVYLYIKSNDFVYTVDENTPEILLQITDPEENVVTSLTGAEYKTVTDSKGVSISGFDVTTLDCLLNIAEDYAINTSDSVTGTTQEWKINLVFVNLNSNQSANEGKNLEAQLILQKEKVSAVDENGNLIHAVLAKDLILLENGGASTIEAKGVPNFQFSQNLTTGMYAAVDNDGTTYYYSGSVDNNWVYFAEAYWRILRVNGDNSIRLIYSGKIAPTEEEKVSYEENPWDNFDPAIPMTINFINIFTLDENDDLTNFSFYENGDFKESVDTWYDSNLKAHENNIHLTSFCDGSANEAFDSYGDSSGFGYYHDNGTAVFKRIFFSHAILLDTWRTGRYTQNDYNSMDITCSPSEEYNYMITVPTAIDAFMAGIDNYTKSFLSGDKFDTISPAYISPSDGGDFVPHSFVFMLNVSGNNFLDGQHYYTNMEQWELKIRPVISLKPDTAFGGTGQWDDPYILADPLSVCTI